MITVTHRSHNGYVVVCWSGIYGFIIHPTPVTGLSAPREINLRCLTWPRVLAQPNLCQPLPNLGISRMLGIPILLLSIFGASYSQIRLGLVRDPVAYRVGSIALRLRPLFLPAAALALIVRSWPKTEPTVYYTFSALASNVPAHVLDIAACASHSSRTA